MHDQSKQDRKFREALERRSSGEGRLDICSALNRVAAQDALGRVASDALMKLRANAQGRRRTIGGMNARHDAYLAKAAVEALSQMHPLDKAAASFRRQPKQEPDPFGENTAQDERYVSPLRAGRIPDAEGGVKGVGRDYEPDTMSIEEMRATAIAKALASRYW